MFERFGRLFRISMAIATDLSLVSLLYLPLLQCRQKELFTPFARSRTSVIESVTAVTKYFLQII